MMNFTYDKYSIPPFNVLVEGGLKSAEFHAVPDQIIAAMLRVKPAIAQSLNSYIADVAADPKGTDPSLVVFEPEEVIPAALAILDRIDPTFKQIAQNAEEYLRDERDDGGAEDLRVVISKAARFISSKRSGPMKYDELISATNQLSVDAQHMFLLSAFANPQNLQGLSATQRQGVKNYARSRVARELNSWLFAYQNYDKSALPIFRDCSFGTDALSDAEAIAINLHRHTAPARFVGAALYDSFTAGDKAGRSKILDVLFPNASDNPANNGFTPLERILGLVGVKDEIGLAQMFQAVGDTLCQTIAPVSVRSALGLSLPTPTEIERFGHG